MRREICISLLAALVAMTARPLAAQDRDEGRREENRREGRREERRDDRRDERREGRGEFGGRQFGGGGPWGGGGQWGGGQFGGGPWGGGEGGSRFFDPNNMRGRGDERRGDDRERDRDRDRERRDRDSSSSSSSRKIIVNPNPGVPGFGTAADGSPSTVAGFGSTAGATGAVAAVDERVRRLAESMLRQYDENRNGILERDEWSKMRGDPDKADTNGDGKVTLDELSVRMASFSQGQGGGQGGPFAGGPWGGSGPGGGGQFGGGGPGSERGERGGRGGRGEWGSGGDWGGGGDEWGGGSSGGSTTTKKTTSSSSSSKPKRFLTPSERLPEGLPKWFAASDADGDGQVVMAEFSATWTDSKASEFARYDVNADGVLTPAECLAVEKKKK